MNFCSAKDVKIVDDWDMVDFPHAMRQRAPTRSTDTAGAYDEGR